MSRLHPCGEPGCPEHRAPCLSCGHLTFTGICLTCRVLNRLDPRSNA